MSNLTSVIDQMTACGLPMLPSGHPVLDGKIHRFGPGKKAWYALRDITLKSGRQVVTGAFGIWQGENNNAVSVKIDWQGISDEEKALALKKQKEFDDREAEKRRKMATFAANRAKTQWEAVKPEAGVISPYLQRKGIDGDGAKIAPDGSVFIPAYQYDPDGQHLVGLQKIDPAGYKRFNKGMQKAGAGLILGEIPPSPQLIMVGEGYATMQSVRMATGRQYPAVVAFDVGNLMHVIRWIRRDWPEAHLLFIADDDYLIRQRYADRLKEDYGIVEVPELSGIQNDLIDNDGMPVRVTSGIKKDPNGDDYIYSEVIRNGHGRSLTFRNAGIHGAKNAAIDAGNASVVYPVFKDRGTNKWTDFNDLHVHESLDVVKDQVQVAIDAALSGNPVPINKKGGKNADGKGERGGRKIKERSADFWAKVNYLLDKFVLIYGTDEAYDSDRHMFIKVANLRLAYGSDEVKFWLNNGERKIVNKDRVIFDPGHKEDMTGAINLYHGWTIQPKKGSYQKIMELVRHLSNGDKAVMTWLLRWIAYPLQNPGAKMRTSIVMHGDEGSGKNLFWEIIVRRIYGEYGGVIGSEQLENQFNDWASKKLFVVADEVITRSELKATKGRLKKIISGDTVMINPKNLNAREEANHMNFVFLSNELQPLVLDSSDRRYLVLWTPPKLEKAFYRAVADEANNGGIEAFYDFLLNTVTFDGFDEYTDPPKTEAKDDLITLSMSPPERFFNDWSKGFLPLPFISCSAQQLYTGFLRWSSLSGERWPPTMTLFGRTIDRIGKGLVRKSLIKYDLNSDVKQRTVYLVGDKPDDKTISGWVEGASSLFEEHLKKYRNVYTQQEM